MTRRFTISELARLVGGELRGDGGHVISGVADITEAGPDDVAWVSQPKYAHKASTSRAGVLLVDETFGSTPMPAIVCEGIERSVAKLLAAFAPAPAQPEVGVHPTAVVDETARLEDQCAIGAHVVVAADATIGKGCVLHAGTYIGRGTRLGADCVLWPNVVVREGCVLGDRVTIHPGSVIGADGFGYHFDEGAHQKIPHIGGVVLGDDVEVGACSCIDRAKFGRTIIGRGTKIDNLVQIGHNVRVGEHCLFVGQVGISGSVRIGNFCVFGGRSGSVDNVTIGDGARLSGFGTVAAKDIPPGATVSGVPARDHREDLRERAAVRRLPAMMEQLKALRKRVEQLEASADDQS